MMRLALFALLCIAPALSAAPIPKEVRAAPSHVGTWELVTLDPKDPSKRLPTGQFWHIDAECGVAFGGWPAVARAKPSERFAFDPKTGEVNHTLIAGNQRMLYGLYRIEGDLLTIQLNTGDPSIRPKGLAPEGGCSLWHLRRAGDSK
jgi:hypothetical protein